MSVKIKVSYNTDQELQGVVNRYGVLETRVVKGQVVPVLNIPMMSDERWNQLAAEQKKQRTNREQTERKGSIERTVQYGIY